MHNSLVLCVCLYFQSKQLILQCVLLQQLTWSYRKPSNIDLCISTMECSWCLSNSLKLFSLNTQSCGVNIRSVCGCYIMTSDRYTFGFTHGVKLLLSWFLFWSFYKSQLVLTDLLTNMVFPGNHHRDYCDRWRKLKALVGYLMLVIRAEINLHPSGQKTPLLPMNVRGSVGWGNTALGTRNMIQEF